MECQVKGIVNGAPYNWESDTSETPESNLRPNGTLKGWADYWKCECGYMNDSDPKCEMCHAVRLKT